MEWLVVRLMGDRRQMLVRKVLLYSILPLAFLGSACAANTPEPRENTRTPTPEISLFQTRTPTSVARTSAPPILPTQTPLPSPTPFTHTIVEGDTLLALAFEYGVSVDEILQVNPGVDPGLLSLGTELVIPLEGSKTISIPTPTPVPIISGAPICYPTGDGGLWCFVSVLNESPAGLEGVKARITLYTPDGQVLERAEATFGLNVIPAGEAVPLAVFFPGPLPQGVFPRHEVAGAFVATRMESRYYPNQVQVDEVTIAEDGQVARLRGEIEILNLAVPEGETESALPEVQVVLQAAAYDERAQVVGLRQWEQVVAAGGDGKVTFDLSIYSLGPAIADVEVLAEIRPNYSGSAESSE